MVTVLVVLGILALIVGGVLFYRNNQKKIEADAAKVSSVVSSVKKDVSQDASKVSAAASSVATDVKKI